MKMLMVIYNEAIDLEAMGVLENCGLKNYTKITGIFGCGNSSGAHLGNNIWPGKNNLIYVVCEEKLTQQILASIKELRKKLGKEGIKAFVLPVEEIT